MEKRSCWLNKVIEVESSGFPLSCANEISNTKAFVNMEMKLLFQSKEYQLAFTRVFNFDIFRAQLSGQKKEQKVYWNWNIFRQIAIDWISTGDGLALKMAVPVGETVIK